MISGSMRPVGRTTCSTICVDCLAFAHARRRRHEDHLVHPLGELLEPQRPVVHRGRQPEAVVDERVLAGTVALELPVQLRDGDVRLVDDAEPVVGEVVEQACRAAGVAHDRRGASSSSRHPSSSRPRAASRGRSWCASAAAGPRASLPRPSSSASRSASSVWMPSIACTQPFLVGDVVRRRGTARARRAPG